MEQWKDIVGYEGKYQVSDLGNVRSLSFSRTGGCKPLKPSTIAAGYRTVILSINNIQRAFSVHKLVALAFLGPCPDGYEIDHINRDKTDNNIENLRYATKRENAWNRANDSSTPLGVDKRGSRYKARIKFMGKEFHLGSYVSKDIAAGAYLNAAREAEQHKNVDEFRNVAASIKREYMRVDKRKILKEMER